MEQRINKIEKAISGKEKTITLDFSWIDNKNSQLRPILFIHGFKGFKDWGPFNVVSEQLVKRGFFVCKMNFSFNGTTKNDPFNFVDLNAFGQNNFTRELADIQVVVEHLQANYSDIVEMPKLALIAHSRGGATAILHACLSQGIHKLVLWNSVATIEKRFPRIDLNEFKRTGVLYIPNARTNQQMPIYYQFVEDYYKNEKHYSLEAQAAQLKVPTLICHGTEDETVSIEEGRSLAMLIPNAVIVEIPGASHSFNTEHPWNKNELSKEFEIVIEKTSEFLKEG